MNQICYKVCVKYNHNYVSSIVGIIRNSLIPNLYLMDDALKKVLSSKYVIKYSLGETILPPSPTKMFVFKKYRHAKKWADKMFNFMEYEIFVCYPKNMESFCTIPLTLTSLNDAEFADSWWKNESWKVQRISSEKSPINAYVCDAVQLLNYASDTFIGRIFQNLNLRFRNVSINW